MITVLFTEQLSMDDVLFIKRYFKEVLTYPLSGIFTKEEKSFIISFSKYPDENIQASKIQRWYRNMSY